MPEPHIRVQGLSKVYRSGGADLVVFSGVDLEVERGEMLALVGESGAGKSTLLHLLGGLDRPSSGTIYYGSTEISGLSDSAQADFRNREIGFVWQIHYLLPEFTALENVMMPLLIRGCPRAQAASESLARLDEVGLRARSTHRAGELSGGEQQRVVLARALVGRPSGSARRRTHREPGFPDRGNDFRTPGRSAPLAPAHLGFRHSQSRLSRGVAAAY